MAGDFDPFGKLVAAMQQERQMRLQERNADMSDRMIMAQLALLEKQNQQEITRRNALAQAFEPEQTGGPLRYGPGEAYQPVDFSYPEPSRSDLYQTFGRLGDVEMAQQFAPTSPKPADIQVVETPEGLYRVPKQFGAPAEKVAGLTPKAALDRQEKEIQNAKDLKKERFENADKLRDEYTKGSSDFIKIRDSYGRIQASVSEPSAAGDLALIFNYMKMLDPGSVVRESEFQTAAMAGGYGDRIKAAMEKIVTGERLSPSMRQDFVNRSDKLFKQTGINHKKLVNEYKRLSDRFGIAPEDVIVSYDSVLPGQSGPSPGAVEDGYRFKGGNPADESSWERVK